MTLVWTDTHYSYVLLSGQLCQSVDLRLLGFASHLRQVARLILAPGNLTTSEGLE
jgi:hypothetical protein